MRSNMKLTLPDSARFPPCLEKAARTSDAVRLRLSVSASTMMATPQGPYPSYRISSKAVPSSPPAPRLMARSMLSLGMLAARATAMAPRSLGFMAGSARPDLAATVNSRMILVKSLARLASWAPFRYMMFLNWE